MEDWSQDFFRMLEQAAAEVENFVQDIGKTVENLANEVNEAVDVATQELNKDLQTISEQVEAEIFTELDRFWQNLLASLSLEIEINSREINIEDSAETYDFFPSPKINPKTVNHPACAGCRHYHGRIYNGNLFVCAMHPYGWEDHSCPDWEEDANLTSSHR